MVSHWQAVPDEKIGVCLRGFWRFFKAKILEKIYFIFREILTVKPECLDSDWTRALEYFSSMRGIHPLVIK